jgi:hypothetical protein
MSFRKELAGTGLVSLFVLGVLCNIEAKAQVPINNCRAFPDGVTPSAPAAVYSIVSKFSVPKIFRRGTNDRIYESRFDGINWSIWSEVPGGWSTISEPAAAFIVRQILQNSGPLELFVRGTDNGIYENTFDGNSWSTWSEVPGGGQTLSGPAAVDDGGSLELFVRGLDDGIWENDLNGLGWSLVPGLLTISTPAGVFDVKSQKLKLFARGINNRIYVNDRALFGNWSGWYEVPPGGALTLAGPSGLIDNNTLKLFITGLDDGIFENDFSGGNWSGWSEISLAVKNIIPEVSDLAVTPSAPTAIELFGNVYPELYLRTEIGRIFECSFPP